MSDVDISRDRIERLKIMGVADYIHIAMLDRIEELEAKLAKAVEALDEAIYLLDPDDEDIAKETGIHRIVTTYKELKGESDE